MVLDLISKIISFSAKLSLKSLNLLRAICVCSRASIGNDLNFKQSALINAQKHFLNLDSGFYDACHSKYLNGHHVTKLQIFPRAFWLLPCSSFETVITRVGMIRLGWPQGYFTTSHCREDYCHGSTREARLLVEPCNNLNLSRTQ